MATGPDALCERPVVHLPPREYQLYNPLKDGLMPTPLDSLGMVDGVRLLEMVARTIASPYRWPKPSNNHHLQWHEAWYPNEGNDVLVNLRAFRELEDRQIRIPTEFHNLIHHITEPPPVPDIDVIFYVIEARLATNALSRAVDATRPITRSLLLTDRQKNKELQPNYARMSRQLDILRSIPAEFQSLEFIPNCKPDSLEGIQRIRSALGQRAATKTALETIYQAQTVPQLQAA